MDLNRLPFIRLYDFWRKEQTTYRIIWLLAMALLVFLAGLVLMQSIWPYMFGISLDLVSEASETWIPLWDITRGYRTIQIDFPVYQQALTYSASPIAPEAFPVWVFTLAQAAGWSLFLTAVAKVKTWWGYVFMLLYALFLHFSGVSLGLAGESTTLGYTLEFVWIIGALLFTYAHQVEWLNLSTLWRWVILFAWTFGPMLALGFVGSWTSLHAVMADSYLFLLFVLIAFVMFAGKEPANLIVYLATNRRNPGQRMDARVIILTLVILMVLQLLWLLDEMRLISLGDGLFLQPTHLFLLAALLIPASSLNQYSQVRKVFMKSSDLSLALIGWVVISLSFVAMNQSVADPVFGLAFDRLLIILFLSVTLGYTVFLIANHLPLMQKRVHLYYLMARGRRVPMATVWLIGLIGLVLAEGYQAWRGVRLFAHVYANHQGDVKLLAGERDEAAIIYEAALANSPVSPKSNYHLAALAVSNPAQTNEAIRLYQTATSVIEFPFARINGALLMSVLDRKPEAISLLRGGVDPLAEQLNNLGVLYREAQQPDSAIVALQKALLDEPQMAAAAVNMAAVYRNNNRPEEAHTFMELALDSREISVPVLAAGYEYVMSTGDSLSIPEVENQASDPLLTYHELLYQWYQGMEPDWSRVQLLAKENSETGPLMLDLIRQFRQDSIDYALSRAEYLSGNFPRQGRGAWMTLGGAYFDRGVPEMAEYSFARAAAAGSTKGQLLEAEMMLEQGKYDSAYVELSEVRVLDESLWEQASRERAMLLAARGQEVFAGVEYDLSSLGFNEWMRVGQYADSTDEYIPALNAYRKAQQLSPDNIGPYLELGKLYTAARDTLAFDNLEAGLQLADSLSPQLKLAIGEAWLAFGDIPQARRQLNQISDSSLRSYQALQAHLAMATGDTATAAGIWSAWYAENLLDTEAIQHLFDIAFSKGLLSDANSLISTAMTYNRVNPDLWYRYARISKAFGFPEDAAFGAVKAIEYSTNPNVARKIAAEFAEELRAIAK